MSVQAKPAHLIEPWFAPFALVNGSAVGLVPILLPLVAIGYGVGQVGLVMGAFNLGAFAAPVTGKLADRYRSYRLLTAGCAAACAASLWLFPLAGPWPEVLLALVNGAGFAGAVTVANLLIVERQPKSQWNQRLGWLETALSVGQGGGLVLAAWLTGLQAGPALRAAAIVPASGVPLALLLIPRQRPFAPRAFAAHWLTSIGHVGEWGPASPSRTHHLARRPSRASFATVLRGRFGWLLTAWMTGFAGAAIVFALYPVLFRSAFGVPPRTSALAFAAIVFASLPLFEVAGRVSQRRGPAAVLAGALAARVILLTVLALLAAARHVSSALPLVAFAGIMFAWSFLSVASPGLTAQLVPGDEGEAQGALNASSGLAGLVGSVAGGFAAAHWGYPAALGIGAAAVATGLAIFATKVMHRASPGLQAPPG
jgi:MFS transporter, DHA1 family, tetracycline resistance protein